MLLTPSTVIAAPAGPVTSESARIPVVSTTTLQLVNRYSRIRPNSIPNLAAIRMMSLTLAQGNVTKSKNMQAFLSSVLRQKPVTAMSGTKSTEYTAVEDAEGFEYISKPVAFVSPSVLPLMGRIHHENHSIRFLKEPRHTLQGENLIIHDGEALITTKRRMTVDCEFVKVRLAKRTDVIISCQPMIVQITNLIDHGRDAVKVEFGNTHLFLKPGEQCCVAREENALFRAHCGDGCGRRGKRNLRADDLSACVCEVSLASMLQNYPLTRQLYVSKHRDDKHTTSTVLHMAACIAFIGSKAKYQWSD